MIEIEFEINFRFCVSINEERCSSSNKKSMNLEIPYHNLVM